MPTTFKNTANKIKSKGRPTKNKCFFSGRSTNGRGTPRPTPLYTLVVHFFL